MGSANRFARAWKLVAIGLLVVAGIRASNALMQASTPVPEGTISPQNSTNSDTTKTIQLAIPRPSVEMIPLTAPAAPVAGRKSSYSVKINGRNWLDSGVVLNAGDQVQWSSSGTLKIGDGREIGPAGLSRGWKDLIRDYPLNSANMGAVVARIGDAEAVPFLIGEKKDAVITQSGHLYLAVNLSEDVTATGDFEVKMQLSSPLKVVSTDPVSKAGIAPRTGMEAATPGTSLANLSATLFSDIPRRVGDQQGDAGDMVNFSLIGSREQLVKAFEAAGWIEVDKTTQDAVIHGLMATLEHQSYLEMPMSTLYLFGRPQDFSYARAAPLAVAAIRHHLRVWQTGKTVGGKPMWVGSATHDNGFEKDQRTGGVTHHIDANVDEERDFIEKSFAAAGVLASAAYVLPENPLQTAETATGGTFHSDGRIVVMELR